MAVSVSSFGKTRVPAGAAVSDKWGDRKSTGSVFYAVAIFVDGAVLVHRVCGVPFPSSPAWHPVRDRQAAAVAVAAAYIGISATGHRYVGALTGDVNSAARAADATAVPMPTPMSRRYCRP